MKKFKVEITQHAYREGTYLIQAPDEDAAYVLAADIRFDYPDIVWTEWIPWSTKYPNQTDIFVTDE